MFEIGDYVIYGSNGVCTVEKIGPIDFQGSKNERLYYTLAPVYTKGSKLFTPVDNDKVIIRPVLSKDEAETLVNDIVNIETSWDLDERRLEESYKVALKSCDCRELIRMIKILLVRKESRLAEGKKVTASEERYLHLAEESLYGELAIALGIEKDEVQAYITKRVELVDRN